MLSNMKVLLLSILFIGVYSQITAPYPDVWGGLVFEQYSGDRNETYKMQIVRRGNIEVQLFRDVATYILSFANNNTIYTVKPSGCSCTNGAFLFSFASQLEQTTETCTGAQGQSGILYQATIHEDDINVLDRACVMPDGLPLYRLEVLKSSELSLTSTFLVINPTLNPDPAATAFFESLPSQCYNTKCGSQPTPNPNELDLPSSYDATYVVSQNGNETEHGTIQSNKELSYVRILPSDQNKAPVEVWFKKDTKTQLFSLGSYSLKQNETWVFRQCQKMEGSSNTFNPIDSTLELQFLYKKTQEGCTSKGHQGVLWRSNQETLCTNDDQTVIYSLSYGKKEYTMTTYKALKQKDPITPLSDACKNAKE